MRDCEHVKFIYNDQSTLTCQVCQETTEISVDNTGAEMKKTFTIISVFEPDRNSTARRWVVAEILQETESGDMGPREIKYQTFTVRYPAWGPNTHYFTSLVLHPGDKTLPHIEAMQIAKELKIFMGVK